MTDKIPDYFDSKHDVGGKLKKMFTWSTKPLKHLSNKEFNDFKRDVRIEYNIAKAGTIADTPTKSNKMINAYNFKLVITRDNVVVSIKNNAKYVHYVNSGTPKITPREFITKNFDEFENDLNSLMQEYKELK